MTVRRHSEDFFFTGQSEVASAIRTVLATRPRYSHIKELELEVVFKTQVRLNWWNLGTEMLIKLDQQKNGTRLSADTKSQWFIIGDIYDFYNQYLREFLLDVRMELQRIALHRQGTRI
jgi:hypothetical protein